MSSVSHAESAAAVAEAKSASGFLRSRLGSLLAVVPLAFWTVNHLWNNLAAFSGAEAWQASVTTYAHPAAQFLTAIVVLLPLVLHMVWGIGRILTSRPNNVRYTYFANLKYALQRLSAIGVMLFLGAHLWLAMLHPRFVEGQPEPFADISHEMHREQTRARQNRVGRDCAVFHFARDVVGSCLRALSSGRRDSVISATSAFFDVGKSAHVSFCDRLDRRDCADRHRLLIVIARREWPADALV
jgi:succinate dehydrogenase / fumarate reductase cytochrome b subunit